MTKFEGLDVIEPRVISGVGGGRQSRFEGVEVKGGEVNNGRRRGDTGMEEAICVLLNIIGCGEVGVGKWGEGRGLMIGNEGLEETSVVVRDATVKTADEVALSVVGGEVKKEDEVENGTAIEDSDGGVGEGCKHESKDSSMGFTMIDIGGGGTNGCRKNVSHEVVWPGGFVRPRRCVSVNGEKGDGSNGGLGGGAVATISG